MQTALGGRQGKISPFLTSPLPTRVFKRMIMAKISKEEQEKLIIEIMQEDEKNGLYED